MASERNPTATIVRVAITFAIVAILLTLASVAISRRYARATRIRRKQAAFGGGRFGYLWRRRWGASANRTGREQAASGGGRIGHLWRRRKVAVTEISIK